MNPSFLKHLIVLLSILVLSGCQNPVIEAHESSTSMQVVPNSWVQLPDDAIAINATIELPNPQGSQNDLYTILSLYTSALGNQCLQASADKTGTRRVLCQTKSNYWQPMPFYNQVTP